MAVQSLTDIVLSPHEVREILNVDNDEIISLCKRASIVPRRNKKGLTYFSYGEVQRLKKIKETKNNLVKITPNAVMERIMQSFTKMEDKISKNVLNALDERLDARMQGVQEIVVELLNHQAENQKLKQKITELNKENMMLKNELRNFQEIGLGFYKRSKVKDYSI